VTIAQEMLEAATSDNINPVALICCELFGTILPVSVETRHKVEQLALKSHTNHALNFLKAQAGYKKGNSVEQLSRSDAGVRFLCLAATFCTLKHYGAADRMDSLLKKTQNEDQLRRTIRQLQTMMDVMKPLGQASEVLSLERKDKEEVRVRGFGKDLWQNSVTIAA